MSVAHGWSVADIQIAFSVFVALETWLTPLEGWIVDRIGPKNGPRLMIAFGGVLVAIAWIVNSAARHCRCFTSGRRCRHRRRGSLCDLCGQRGQVVSRPPRARGRAYRRRFGAGAAVTVVPIREVIAADGYAAAFFWFGLVQGIVIFVLSWRCALRFPARPPRHAARVIQTTESFSPQAMLATPVFWIMYIMFLLVAASGLMATAQVALIARRFLCVFNVVAAAGRPQFLTVALLVDNVANGLARPLFGWVSDRIGREYTMALAFSLGGISYWLLGSFGATPWAFVVFAGLIFLTWGEIYSLFPSTCTDSFGPKYATTNLSFLYTAKGVAAFLVPLANVIKTATGSWHMVFVVTAIMNFVVVGMALFVLRPLRSRSLASGASGPSARSERVLSAGIEGLA